jgi:hypothetical protein
MVTASELWVDQVDRLLQREKGPSYYFQTRRADRHGAIEWTLVLQSPRDERRYVTFSIAPLVTLASSADVEITLGLERRDERPRRFTFSRMPERHLAEVSVEIEEVARQAFNLLESSVEFPNEE